MSLLGSIEGFQTTHGVTQAQIEALGYTRMEDGRYRSPDGESVLGADEAAQLVQNAPDADPMINGVQYRSIGGFANNSSDPEQAMQQEIAHLRRFGIEPVNHPQYGWIAPDNEAFARAHPIQEESGFDKALGVIMRTAIAGGMTAGIGTGLAGAAGLTGLPATAVRAATSAVLSGATGGNPLTSAAGSLIASGAGDLTNGLDAPWGVNPRFEGVNDADLRMELGDLDPTTGLSAGTQFPAPVQEGPTTTGTGPGGSLVPNATSLIPAAVTRVLNGTATTGDYAALGLTAAAVGGLATMSGDRTTTSTTQNVVQPRTPEEIRLLQLQIDAFERDARLNNQITPVIQRQIDAANAELDRQAAHEPSRIRTVAMGIYNDPTLSTAQKQEKIAGLMRQYGVTATEVANATGHTVADVTAYTGVNLTDAERNAASQQELLDIAVRNARQGTNATPEQITQIDAATRAAQTAGEIDIARFRDETLRRINEEVSAASGLMPTDTPITALGDRAAAEVIRQQGGLTANLQNANANARLNYPLAAQTVQNATTANAANLNLASQQFQRQLEQTAANNRYRLFASPYSLPPTNTSAGNMGLGLANERFAGGIRTQSTTRPTGLSDYGSFFGGLGGIVRGVSSSSLFG